MVKVFLLRKRGPMLIVNRSQRGGALAMTLASVAVLSITGYLLVSFLRGQRVHREGEVSHIQAQALASDLIELGKYFLAYEKIVFTQDSLKLDASRKSALDVIMKQGIGSLEPAPHFLTNACGGYDAEAVELGDLKINQEKVFCPLYLRNPLFDGNILEKAVFRLWGSSKKTQILIRDGSNIITKTDVSRAAVVKEESDGSYSLEIDLKKSILDPKNSRIRLGVEQNFVSLLKTAGAEAKVRFIFHTKRAGFETISNERFVTLSSFVKYGESFQLKTVSSSETLIFQAPSVKDFALFLVYPETSSGSPTRKFSEAFRFGGKQTQIYGRVFFHGDIDIPLQELPEFHETVVISGRLINQNSQDLLAQRALLQAKFKKGLVTDFPVDRLVKDGRCVGFYEVSNQSEMYCKKPSDETLDFTMRDYILNLVNICSGYPVSVDKGNYHYEIDKASTPIVVTSCTPSEPGKQFVSGGVYNVKVSGSHAFVLSPIQNLIVSSSSSIYGTVLGGHISVRDGTRFYSISHLKVGLPGIGNQKVLAEVSTEAASIKTGVGVPIMNMPLFKNTAMGR
jgi:hypothetical protein